MLDDEGAIVELEDQGNHDAPHGNQGGEDARRKFVRVVTMAGALRSLGHEGSQPQQDDRDDKGHDGKGPPALDVDDPMVLLNPLHGTSIENSAHYWIRAGDVAV